MNVNRIRNKIQQQCNPTDCPIFSLIPSTKLKLCYVESSCGRLLRRSGDNNPGTSHVPTIHTPTYTWLGGHPKGGFLATLPLPVNETQFMKQETGIMPLCRCLSCRIVTTTVFRYQEKACHKLDASDMESDIKCRTSRNTNQDFQLVTFIMWEDVKKAKHNHIKLTTRRMHCQRAFN